MKIIKVGLKLQASFTVQELARMLVANFFTNLTNDLNQKKISISDVNLHVKRLAKKSVDSIEYEFYIALLDLYGQFQKDCDFRFNLKDTYNFRKTNIITLTDLYKYRDDPPDVIIGQKNSSYEFEFKRYRGNMDFDSISNFIKRKITNYYADKSNYYILLQPDVFSNVSINIFEKLHDGIKKINKNFGIIAFSFKDDCQNIVTIQVFPEFITSKRNVINDGSLFTDLLNPDNLST
jgi:hypothetical protein